jgi:hypothetical protein
VFLFFKYLRVEVLNNEKRVSFYGMKSNLNIFLLKIETS